MTAVLKPAPGVNWRNLLFIGGTGLIALVGSPLYLWKYGISFSEMALFAFYMTATGLSVTIGYHRLFTHANFKANNFVKFIMLFFGVAAFEESALIWASDHRNHHRYVDTDQDPYSIKKGFFYAHIGWLLFWKHPSNLSNVKDLQRSRLVMHQHNHYYVWATVAGILTPLLLGALTGHILGALIFAICLRLTLVYHGTFFINSICHMFGNAAYDKNSTARDHWFVALLSFGEGYHNFHHRFPADYRNGVRWYHWDPSKWMIALLARLGLVWNLRKASPSQILQARRQAENPNSISEIKNLSDLALPFKLPSQS